MPFGYSKKIFKYPTVQYIPLDRYKEKIGLYPTGLTNPRVYIYQAGEEKELQKKLNFLREKGNYPIKDGQLAILVLNGKINLIMYRAYEVTMVGSPNPGHFQVFNITTEYFYKDRLIFTFYDGKTDQRLDWVRFDPVTF